MQPTKEFILSDDAKNPGWNRDNGAYWARPEHATEISGDYPSQDRVALDPEVVQHIRDTDPAKADED